MLFPKPRTPQLIPKHVSTRTKTRPLHHCTMQKSQRSVDYMMPRPIPTKRDRKRRTLGGAGFLGAAASLRKRKGLPLKRQHKAQLA